MFARLINGLEAAWFDLRVCFMGIVIDMHPPTVCVCMPVRVHIHEAHKGVVGRQSL